MYSLVLILITILSGSLVVYNLKGKQLIKTFSSYFFWVFTEIDQSHRVSTPDQSFISSSHTPLSARKDLLNISEGIRGPFPFNLLLKTQKSDNVKLSSKLFQVEQSMISRLNPVYTWMNWNMIERNSPLFRSEIFH